MGSHRSQMEMFAGLGAPAPAPKPQPPRAVFSDCGAYRYRLGTHWAPAKGHVVWVMLNPSTAGRPLPDGEVETDMTFLKCCGFAERWGFGGVELVNLYAYVETHSPALDALAAARVDLVGPDNDRHVAEALAGGAKLVAVAWGGHPLVAARAPAVLAKVPAGVEVVCLGRTQEGHPRHPARLAYATAREPYAAGWPPAGITGPGKWGTTDGRTWVRVDGVLAVSRHPEDGGFRGGYLVTSPVDAWRIMHAEAKGGTR